MINHILIFWSKRKNTLMQFWCLLKSTGIFVTDLHKAGILPFGSDSPVRI